MATSETAEKESRRQQDLQIEHLRSIQIGRTGSQQSIASPREIISRAVRREYPTMSYPEVQKATRELVLAPRKATIKVGNDTIAVEDLQYKIAESIELMNAETNSAQEYFSWFEECAQILQHMNDGYVTDSDLSERNSWINDSYAREGEIMTCMGLYQNSAFPEAKKKYQFLYNKLVKLRQIRNAIKETTSSTSDETRDRIDEKVKYFNYKRALVYLSALKEFVKHEIRWNMPKTTLRKLRMYRGDDEDLESEYDDYYGMYEPDYCEETYYGDDENDSTDGYDDFLADGSYDNETYDEYPFGDKLKEDILFNWDDSVNWSPVNSQAEELSGINVSQQENEDDVKARITNLSGRRPPYKSSVVGTRKSRTGAFDANKFVQLSSKKSNLMGK